MSCSRTFRVWTVLAGVAVAAACGGGDSGGPTAPPTVDPPRATTVTVSPATAELDVGETVQLTAVVRDQNSNVMAGASVTWMSGAGTVATVNASGLVTGVAGGTATITARSGSAQGTAQITVVSVTAPVVSVEVSSPAEPIALGEPLQLGEALQLSVEALDENGRPIPGVEFSWESSNTSVATVDATGLVTAVAAGTATITASAGDVQATVEITVVSATQPVVSVEVSPSAETITLGGMLQLSAAAFDENGQAVSGAEFSWESSNASVATVDATGLVTAVAAGTATITASVGGARGTAEITVADAGAGFRDDFVPGSLSDWEIEEGTRAEISEGVLRMTKVTDSGAGVFRLLDSPITSWEARVSLARAEAGGDVCVALGVSDQRYRSYLLDIGPAFTDGGERFNYFFGLLDDRSNFHDDIAAFGHSEAIRGGAGEFTEITIALKDGRLSGHAGAAELFTFELSDRLPTDLNAVAFGMNCAGIWEARPGRTALFDWIEVRGERSNRSNHPPEAVGS